MKQENHSAGIYHLGIDYIIPVGKRIKDFKIMNPKIVICKTVKEANTLFATYATLGYKCIAKA